MTAAVKPQCAMLGVFNAVWQEEKVMEEVVIKLMVFGMKVKVEWMFEEDWEEDTLDRLGRKVRRMVMLVFV